ncbi:MAG: hypothetical protein OXF00_09120 [bacterium]|nr:hypothetical protein [bacterium]
MQVILISVISVLGAGLIGFITTVVHGLRSDNAQLRNEHASLRAETKADNASLRAELKADNAELRAELSKLTDLVHDLANKMVTAMAELEVRLSDKISAEIRAARESAVGQ